MFNALLDNTEQVDVSIINSEVIEHSSSASLNPQLLTQLSKYIPCRSFIRAQVLEKGDKQLLSINRDNYLQIIP